MDKLDVRIVRELLQGEGSPSLWPERATTKPPLARLSRNLGVAESTVRKRYARLSGLFGGWMLMVNPSLLESRWGAIWLQVPGEVSKQKVLEKLGLIDDMLVLVNYASRCIGAAFLYPNGTTLEGKVRQIRKLSDCEESLYTDIPVPPCEAALSKTDLQIISARRVGMAKSNREVAEDLGISPRTVKRRLLRLVGERAVWPIAVLNVAALEGRIYADLLVLCRDPETRAVVEAQILTLVDEYLFFVARFVDLSQFSLMVPSLPAARTILDRVSRMTGVKLARFDFVEDWIGRYDVVGERLRRMMKGGSRAGVPGMGVRAPGTREP